MTTLYLSSYSYLTHQWTIKVLESTTITINNNTNTPCSCRNYLLLFFQHLFVKPHNLSQYLKIAANLHWTHVVFHFLPKSLAPYYLALPCCWRTTIQHVSFFLTNWRTTVLEGLAKKFPTCGFIILDRGRSFLIGCENTRWLCSKFETFGLGSKTYKCLMLLHRHSNLFLCSKFKISILGNRSQRFLVLFYNSFTFFLKGTVATTWEFSYFFFEFLKDFDYCLPLEGFRQKLELLYFTLHKSSTRVLVWELVTWTKVNDFFSRQSKDQWKTLSPQIDKTNGPHPSKT